MQILVINWKENTDIHRNVNIIFSIAKSIW